MTTTLHDVLANRVAEMPATVKRGDLVLLAAAASGARFNHLLAAKVYGRADTCDENLDKFLDCVERILASANLAHIAVREETHLDREVADGEFACGIKPPTARRTAGVITHDDDRVNIDSHVASIAGPCSY